MTHVKSCVILNPSAGTAPQLAELEQKLGEKLPQAELRVTNAPGEAADLARAAQRDGHTLIVAAGGDGTINQVVNGIASDPIRAQLGILPLGTGNDFARSIGVPPDIDAALELLAAGQTRRIDLVRVVSAETCHFINVSAGGFSGLVDEKLTDEIKQSWGPLAYLRAATAALPELSHYTTELILDDEAPLIVDIYSLVVANACYVAGGIPIAPQAQPDDGLLDVLVVPAASLSQLALLVPQILLGTHLSSELVIYRRAQRLRVNSTPGMWYNVDGEMVGNEPASFTILPQAIEVVVGDKLT